MHTRIFVVLSLLILGGCGGGESSSTANNPPPPPPPAAQYPLDNAISALEQMNQDYTLRSTSGGNNYTLQLSSVPGSQSTFNGQPALTSVKTLTLSGNGTVLSTDISIAYFNISPFTSLGKVSKSSGRISVYANQVALPQLATIGQSGAFGTETVYTDNTLTTIYGTATDTWTLNPDTPPTAAFCLNSSFKYQTGGSGTESDCYKIDERGNVLSLRVTLSVNGTVLDFQ